MKRTVFLFLLIGFLLLGSSNCRKKEFAITGLWDMYWNGTPTPGRFEFSGTAVSGTVLEVGILPSVQYHTYVVDGNQITIKFYMVHGIAWSRRNCTGLINEEEERMAGTYFGQSGGLPDVPVNDFSGTWSAEKVQ